MVERPKNVTLYVMQITQASEPRSCFHIIPGMRRTPPSDVGLMYCTVVPWYAMSHNFMASFPVTILKQKLNCQLECIPAYIG